MADININVRITPSVFRWGLALLLVSVSAMELSSESVNLTTYYPAPSGIYTRLIATGATFLARDGGTVGIGAATTPASMLSVAGGVQLGSDAAACTAAKAGTVRYNAGGNLSVCNGNTLNWDSLNGASTPSGTLCGWSTPGPVVVAQIPCQGVNLPACPVGYTYRDLYGGFDGNPNAASCVKN